MFHWLSKRFPLSKAPDSSETQAASSNVAADSSLTTGDAESHFVRGNNLAGQGRLEEAIECYRRALKLRPAFAEASCNLGTALKERGFPVDAIACYEDAIRLRPGMSEVHFNLGLAFQSIGEFARAMACFQQAVALDPRSADARYALGYLHANEDSRESALQCFEQALVLNPEYAEARWGFAMSQLLAVCGPADDAERGRAAFSRELDLLDRWFDGGRGEAGARAVGSIPPFRLAYHGTSNRELLQRYGALCSRIMAEWAKRRPSRLAARRNAGEPVRVAVVSRYFRQHSVWNAIVKGWFRNVDYKQFVLSAFCLGPDQDSETRVAQAHAANFEQGTKSLAEWVEAIANEEPHVVIYPEIGMDPMTLRLAALRLAPVQIAAWGHPETTGLPTIDYYLSAEDFEPRNAQEHYTERLVSLPGLGCFTEPSGLKPAAPSLGRWNLSPDRPLLICPGTPFKYAPGDDELLVRIAMRLPKCQLAFFTYRQAELSQRLQRRLEAAFRDSGVDPMRQLRFLPWLDPAEFHGLLRHADACLDTIGFSGFNTAMQAIECGLPIVTLEGHFMRGRFASGILRRLGARELIAQDREGYVDLAVRLVQDKPFSQNLRRHIAEHRSTLYCDLAPIRALEKLLLEATA